MGYCAFLKRRCRGNLVQDYRRWCQQLHSDDNHGRTRQVCVVAVVAPPPFPPLCSLSTLNSTEDVSHYINKKCTIHPPSHATTFGVISDQAWPNLCRGRKRRRRLLSACRWRWQQLVDLVQIVIKIGFWGCLLDAGHHASWAVCTAERVWRRRRRCCSFHSVASNNSSNNANNANNCCCCCNLGACQQTSIAIATTTIATAVAVASTASCWHVRFNSARAGQTNPSNTFNGARLPL